MMSGNRLPFAPPAPTKPTARLNGGGAPPRAAPIDQALVASRIRAERDRQQQLAQLAHLRSPPATPIATASQPMRPPHPQHAQPHAQPLQPLRPLQQLRASLQRQVSMPAASAPPLSAVNAINSKTHASTPSQQPQFNPALQDRAINIHHIGFLPHPARSPTGIQPLARSPQGIQPLANNGTLATAAAASSATSTTATGSTAPSSTTTTTAGGSVERVLRSRATVDRATLTASGEVVGGYDDFKSGTDITTLATSPLTNLVAANVPFVVLKDWRPLSEVVPLWRYYLKLYPELKGIYVLDCGAEGDCLFHVVAAGYNQFFASLVFHMEGTRDLAASQMSTFTESMANEFIIDLYGKIPDGIKGWSLVDKVQYMQSIIRRPGNAYWGETGTLRQLLLRSPPFLQHKIGFMVIYIRNKPVEFRPITDAEKAFYERKSRKPPKEVPSKYEPRVEMTAIRLQDTKYLMLLHCLDNSHWILVGYAPNIEKSPEAKIASTFPINSFPKPLYPFLREKQ